MRAKKFILISILAFVTVAVKAQQEPMLSQYMFNGLFLNPAYTGSHRFVEASALYRAQWTGFDGAPVTQTFGIDGPLSDETMGLGLTFINDEIGDTRQTEIFANWSYHIFFDPEGKTKLSFGIRAGFSDYSARLTETGVWDEADPVFSQNVSNEFIPKFGAGVYVYSSKWYAGFSIPTLYAMDDNIVLSLPESEGRYVRSHTYLTGGYVFSTGSGLKIKPSVLIKYLQDTPVQADINCNVLINRTLWLGASYRTSDAIVGIIEYNITPSFRLGYSYDITTSAISNYNNGSHEIMLSYKFGKESILTRTPRYF